ncbi:hypothetical protein [[Mycoplasma] testudinis]|uniref:hypothetical protein n=1 Tax=[Mycoplasma] testudinis TaxID=33924 RepID=UPI000480E820|nr:hypothetical protein [[Mycoplasma] testudinis]
MRKKHFNMKAWIGTWSTLGAIGIIVPAVMVVDSRFNPNSILINNEVLNTASGNQDNQSQSAQIADYYAKLPANLHLKNNANQNLFPSDNSFREINTYEKLNSILAEDSQIPDLPDSISADNNLQIVLLAPNDNSGSMSVRVLVQQSSFSQLPYQMNGELGTPNNSGRIISISGFKNVNAVATSWYSQLKQVFANNTSEINAHGKNITTQVLLLQLNAELMNSSSDPVNVINNYLDNKIAAFPSDLTSRGYKPHLANITANQDDGTLSFNLAIVNSNEQPLSVVMNQETIANGLDLKLSGIKTGVSFALADNLTFTTFTTGNSINWQFAVPGVSTKAQALWYLQAVVHYGFTDQFINQVIAKLNETSELTNHTNGYIITFDPSNPLPTNLAYSSDGSSLVAGGHGPNGTANAPSSSNNGMNGSWKLNGISGVQTELRNLLSLSSFQTMSRDNPHQSNPTISNESRIIDYYKNLADSYALNPNPGGESDKLPQQSGITNQSTLTNVNNALNLQKIPDLASALEGYELKFVPGSFDNNAGTLKLRIMIADASGNLYATNGGITNTANAGKELTLTGYKAFPTITKQFYDSLNVLANGGNISVLSTTTDSAQVAANNLLTTSGDKILTTINNYLPDDKKIRTFIPPFTANGYKLSITDISPNYTTGTVSFNLQIVNGANQIIKPDGTTEITSTDNSFKGPKITLAGLKTGFNQLQATLDPVMVRMAGDNWSRWTIYIQGITTKQQALWYLQAIVATNKQNEFINQIVQLFTNGRSFTNDVYMVSFNPLDRSNSIPNQAPYSATGDSLVAGGRSWNTSDPNNGMNGRSKIDPNNNVAGLRKELTNLLSLSAFKTVDSNNPFVQPKQ